jgi:hypothetical protein
MSDEVQKKIKELSVEGKITCAQAEVVAKEYGLSRRVVGELIDKSELKIISCQLGCF